MKLCNCSVHKLTTHWHRNIGIVTLQRWLYMTSQLSTLIFTALMLALWLQNTSLEGFNFLPSVNMASCPFGTYSDYIGERYCFPVVHLTQTDPITFRKCKGTETNQYNIDLFVFLKNPTLDNEAQKLSITHLKVLISRKSETMFLCVKLLKTLVGAFANY